MMKKKIILASTLGLAAAFTGITWYVGNEVYKETFGAKPRTTADEMERQYWQEIKKLKPYDHQKFMLESSKNGYLIETLHIKSTRESENAIVLIHGIKSNFYDLASVALRYLNDGYNVILYNQRQTGLTGGDNFTLGLYERFDLEEIMTVARRLYPNGVIGVHGFSMGAATAAMHAELNKKTRKVDFYVLDSPYHTLESAIKLRLETDRMFLLRCYTKWAGNIVLRLKEKVKYQDIEPVRAIAHADVPVLLLHGKKDTVTHPGSSQILHDAIPHKNKKLVYFSGDGHCIMHCEQEAEYFKEIYSFIANYVLKR